MVVKKIESETKLKKVPWKLYLILVLCFTPAALSYLTYYIIKPTTKTNYGFLINPRDYPVPNLSSDNQLIKSDINDYKGKWLLIHVNNSFCDDLCQKKLYFMRQLRLTQGKKKDRIERLWLVTDNKKIDEKILVTYSGTRVIYVDLKKTQNWLPVEEDANLFDHLFLIDPLGNLMMRFPKNPDPNLIKNDLYRLLKASRIG
tara:strand:+ start:1274 stop:1876 length:603 start_codon:yes stop_codon:yes gene_type:complete